MMTLATNAVARVLMDKLSCLQNAFDAMQHNILLHRVKLIPEHFSCRIPSAYAASTAAIDATPFVILPL
jgi:hypothetical protein